MIQFLTAFLGLLAGVQTIELRVEPPVASVELRLDGVTVGELDAAPWTIDCDFGDALAPHELVAVARDAQGEELHRIVRWVNADRPRGGGPGVTTPVAVIVEQGTLLPAPEAMDAWFLASGRPVAVERVERGDAEVAFVRDPVAQRFLDALTDLFYGDALTRLRGRLGRSRVTPLDDDLLANWTDLDLKALEATQAPAVEVGLESLQLFGRLEPGSTVHFLTPMAAAPSRVEARRRVFHHSKRYASNLGGFLWLTREVSSVLSHFRLADAAAVAGRQLNAGGRRRALVLLLAGEWEDGSFYTAAQARPYLAQVQVPVFLWSLSSADAPEGWGAARDLAFAKKPAKAWRDPLEAAVRDLRRHLASQRIVHLRGHHLPHSITLASAARGLRLVGGPIVDEP